MSYCRSGKDSDVYVWCGKDYNVCFSEGVQSVKDKMDFHGLISCQFDKPQDLLSYLYQIRELGFRVPEYAFERLKWEMGWSNHYQEWLDKWVEETENGIEDDDE
jgi:hypothetical protein